MRDPMDPAIPLSIRLRTLVQRAGDEDFRRVLTEAAEEVERHYPLRIALRRAGQAMEQVTVFVTSRQRIMRPDGEAWWDDERKAVAQAIEGASSTTRGA